MRKAYARIAAEHLDATENTSISTLDDGLCHQVCSLYDWSHFGIVTCKRVMDAIGRDPEFSTYFERRVASYPTRGLHSVRVFKRL